jgi:hypothetical protein
MDNPATEQTAPTSRKPIKVLISVVIFAIFFILLLVAIAAIVSNKKGGKIEVEYDFSNPQAFLQKINSEMAQGYDPEILKNFPTSVKFPEGTESYEVEMTMGMQATPEINFTFDLEGFITKIDGGFGMEMSGQLSGTIPDVNLTQPIVVDLKMINADMYFKIDDFSAFPSDVTLPLAMVGIKPGAWLKISMQEYFAQIGNTYPTDMTSKMVLTGATSAPSITKDGITYECLALEIDKEVIPAGTMDFNICADSGKYYPVLYNASVKSPDPNLSSPIMTIEMKIDASRDSRNVEKPGDAIDLTSLLNPGKQISGANDARIRDDVQTLLNAITLYQVDNKNRLPTAGSKALPVVTQQTLFSGGVVASSLDDIAPTYIVVIPKSPSNAEYYVGVTSTGKVIIGGKLTDGSNFIVER